MINPQPRCTVCHHPRCYDIDCALLAGHTQTSVAAHYRLSTSALSRHHAHLKKQISQARQALQEKNRNIYKADLAATLERLKKVAEAAAGSRNDAKIIQTSLAITGVVRLLDKLNTPGPDSHGQKP